MISSEESSPLEYENIIDDIGGYGKFQKFLIFSFMIPLFTFLPWYSMPIIFLTSIPDHWCNVPVLAKSNLSLNFQKKLIRPPSDPKCSRYDVNYTEMVLSHRWRIDEDAPTKPCDEGWNFDKTNYDETATTKWNLVCKDDHFVPLLLTCAFIGVILGTPVFNLLSNSFGRKSTFMIAASLIAVTDVGSSICPNFTFVIILRIAEGMGITAVMTEAYIIILELVSPKLHTRINGISSTAWSAGACLVPLLAWLTRSWVWFTTVNSTSAACLLLYYKFLPESPGWLISKGKYDEVVNIFDNISKINGRTPYNRHLLLEKIRNLGEECRKKVKREPKISFKVFFYYKRLRKRLILLTICWMCNSLPFFGLQMNTRNLPGDQFINFFLASMVEVPAHFATFLLITIGRKICLLSSLSLTVISCFLTLPLKNYDEIYVISTILSKMGTTSTYMTLYALAPELFPLSLKIPGLTFCSLMGSAASCFSSYAVLMSKYGMFVPFMIFFATTTIAFGSACFLPETLGKTVPKTITEADSFETGLVTGYPAEMSVVESVPSIVMTPAGLIPSSQEQENSSDDKSLIVSRKNTMP